MALTSAMAEQRCLMLRHVKPGYRSCLLIADWHLQVLLTVLRHVSQTTAACQQGYRPSSMFTDIGLTAEQESRILNALHALPCDSWLASAGALNSALPYGPAVADHCILSAGLQTQQQLKASPLTAEQQQGLLEAVQAWERWLDDCDVRAPKGYITYRRAGQHPVCTPCSIPAVAVADI